MFHRTPKKALIYSSDKALIKYFNYKRSSFLDLSFNILLSNGNQVLKFYQTLLDCPQQSLKTGYTHFQPPTTNLENNKTFSQCFL